jgi:hypothetical protein
MDIDRLQKVHLSRDKLNQADPTRVAMTTVALFDCIQQQPPEIRTLALASALSHAVKHMGISPGDVMTACGNLRAGAEKMGRVEFLAVDDYLNNHWKGARRTP